MLSNNRAAQNATNHRENQIRLEICEICQILHVCLVTILVDTSLQGAGLSRVAQIRGFQTT